MSGNKIALRYAKSLFSVANEKGMLEEVMSNMRLFEATFNDSSELRTALKNPIINAVDKEKFLLKVFSSFHQTTQSFISLVIKKNRSAVLGDISKQFIELYNSHNQIVNAEVSSAAALTEKEQQEIISLLAKRTGAKTINLIQHINADLIGGLVIKYGDNLLDSSVLSRINNLKKELQIA